MKLKWNFDDGDPDPTEIVLMKIMVILIILMTLINNLIHYHTIANNAQLKVLTIHSKSSININSLH